MSEWLPIIGTVLLIAGAFFTVTGAVGILRMPDFFTRLHPAGIKDALGLPLIAIGLMCVSGATLTSLKIFFLVVFILLTSPTACQALARAALACGQKPIGKAKKKVLDETRTAVNEDAS